MNELLPREFAEAKARMDARRDAFRTMSSPGSSLDQRALEAARARARMQPRFDQTINELPLLSALSTDVVPIWRNGETAQVPISSIAALAPPLTPQTNLTVFNVKTFGAVGNNIIDDTAAIQSAINATNGAGGIVYFPPGIYKISAPLLCALPGLTIMGANPGSAGGIYFGSVIIQYALGSDIIDASNVGLGAPSWGLCIRDLGLTYNGGAGAATAGAAIRLNYINYCVIERVYVFTCYDCIYIGTDNATASNALYLFVDNCILAGVKNRCFVVAGVCANLNLENNQCFGFGGNAATSTVMQLGPGGYCDVMVFSNNDCEGFSGGLIFNATQATGTNGVVDAYFDSNIFDNTNTSEALALIQSGIGNIGRLKFTSNWFTCANATIPAVLIQSAVAGKLADVTFRGNFFQGGGNGVTFSGAGPPQDVEFSDNQIYGCGGYGAQIASGLRVRFRTNTVGPSNGAPGNTLGGINIASAASSCVIEGNDLSGNIGPNLTVAGSPGLIRNNLGANPFGLLSGSPAMPATGATVYNTRLTDATVYVNAGTATAVTVAISGSGGSATAVSVPTGAVVPFRVPYNAGVTITYATAVPTWIWVYD